MSVKLRESYIRLRFQYRHFYKKFQSKLESVYCGTYVFEILPTQVDLLRFDR